LRADQGDRRKAIDALRDLGPGGAPAGAPNRNVEAGAGVTVFGIIEGVIANCGPDRPV
jgi:hypothetical protein